MSFFPTYLTCIIYKFCSIQLFTRWNPSNNSNHFIIILVVCSHQLCQLLNFESHAPITFQLDPYNIFCSFYFLRHRTLHGLWPEWGFNCGTEAFDEKNLASIMTRMHQEWPACPEFHNSEHTFWRYVFVLCCCFFLSDIVVVLFEAFTQFNIVPYSSYLIIPYYLISLYLAMNGKNTVHVLAGLNSSISLLLLIYSIHWAASVPAHSQVNAVCA